MPAACDVGPEPKRRRAKLTDTTVEAMGQILEGNPRGLLLFRDELSAWFANLSVIQMERSSHLARSLWRAILPIDRKSHDNPAMIERFLVAILGGVQPDRINDMLDGPDDGLVPRFLPYWPEVDGMDFVRRPEEVDRLKEALQRLTELIPNEDGTSVRCRFTERALDVFETLEEQAWRSDKWLSNRSRLRSARRTVTSFGSRSTSNSSNGRRRVRGRSTDPSRRRIDRGGDQAAGGIFRADAAVACSVTR